VRPRLSLEEAKTWSSTWTWS